MKKQTGLVFCGLVLLFIWAVSSCKKTVTNNTSIESSTPLYALIIGDTSLSIYNAAVQKAGDKPLFLNTRFITVLIPTNTAFLAAGISKNSINAMSVAGADSLVRYHYIDSLPPLDSAAYTGYKSLSGPTVYGMGTLDTTVSYFNGSLANRQKLAGSNAAVYELSAPLRIPAASIAQLLSADTSLSYFAEAVKVTGINLVPASDWNTILAPDNNAFIAAGYPTLASIDNSDINTLTDIVQYHIVPGQYFSNTFSGLITVPSQEGNSINVTFSDAIIQFTGVGNTNAASIELSDKVAGSSVIVHKINGLLMP
ncbi:MAG: fasciclin domain-containing protein [Chitinophagaceae bacterium]